MKTWNTLVPVVDLIPADSGEEAVTILRARLVAAGFEPYEGEPGNAFESEDPDIAE
jgi:hypothetical protein